jgi:hypothetical protein
LQGWRLRLKQDLLVFEGGGETSLAAKRVAIHVAMVHKPGHPEPWIIALCEAPTVHRAFDDGLGWGIEAMFSDFKSRGFGLEDSHLQRVERLKPPPARPDLVVQARHPPPSGLPAAARATAPFVERVGKLMGSKDFTLR